MFFSLTLIGFLSKTRADYYFNNISVYQHPGLKQTSSCLSPNDNPQGKKSSKPCLGHMPAPCSVNVYQAYEII